MAPMSTRANGADFRSSYILNTTFTGAQLLAANFDGTLLVKADFSNADLGLATFRNAILLAPIVKGANLKSADLDGAIVFGTKALEEFAATAAADTFRPERFRADALSREDLLNISIVNQNLTAEDIDQYSSKGQAWKLTRVQPFDDGAAP